jgi:hypothetical protein
MCIIVDNNTLIVALSRLGSAAPQLQDAMTGAKIMGLRERAMACFRQPYMDSRAARRHTSQLLGATTVTYTLACWESLKGQPPRALAGLARLRFRLRVRRQAHVPGHMAPTTALARLP